MQQVINCPRCRNAMQTRLGEFVCNSCGMVLAPPEPEDKPAPKPAAAAAPAPPPVAAPAAGKGQAEGYTPYQFQRTEFLDPMALDFSGKKPKPPALTVEKNIWFAINLVHALIAVFVPFLFETNLVGMGMIGAGDELAKRGIIAVLWLAAVWFAMFEREPGWKWTCSGAIVLIWVMIGYAYFSTEQITELVNNTLPVLGEVTGMLNGLLILRLVWDAWFVSILLREIREINAKGL